MNWDLYAHKPKGVTAKAFITKRLTSNFEGVVIDSAMVGKVLYMAYKLPDATVTCLAAKITQKPKERLNLNYWVKSESAGCFWCDCPERILKQLTDPPPSSLAASWRRRCWENIETRKGKVLPQA